MSAPLPFSKLQSFLAVAETLNFRRAAERLSIAQPALSRGIKQFEDQLGFALFERSTRRVILTKAGDHLFREAKAATQQLTQAFDDAREIATGSRGRIMVAYNSFAASGPMSDIIIQFRKRYPHCAVSLNLLGSGEQRDGIINGSVDVGFALSVTSTPPLSGFVISREQLVALIPDDHRLAPCRSVSLDDLSSEQFVIGTRTRWSGFRPLIDGLFERKGLAMNVAEEADDLPLLLQMVRTGIGCTILSSSCKLTLPPGIRILEIENVDAMLEVSLIWREDHLSILAKRFTEVAREIAASECQRSESYEKPR